MLLNRGSSTRRGGKATLEETYRSTGGAEKHVAPASEKNYLPGKGEGEGLITFY